MKNSNTIIWIILLLLTIISVFTVGMQFALYSILITAAIKILLVAYQFMDLKKAHPFWIIAVMLLTTVVVVAIIFQYA